MIRRRFSEWSSLTRAVAVGRRQLERRAADVRSGQRFADTADDLLPVVVYRHASLIRRRLGDVDARLQENKATNLALVAPRLTNIVIEPGQVFSFWRLAGPCTARRGFREGLTIAGGLPSSGVGGGMCQFTNLIHWLALHSPLAIVEHHHHDGVDLFPDFGRTVPFGCGTSILYNYRDYRLKNPTDIRFQFVFDVTETHLKGELRASERPAIRYHIDEREAGFVRSGGDLFRRNAVYRRAVDRVTGNVIDTQLVKRSWARVLYSEDCIDPTLIHDDAAVGSPG